MPNMIDQERIRELHDRAERLSRAVFGNILENQNTDPATAQQLKWDLLRQKEAWDTGQRYNNPELQARAHERADMARALAQAALGGIPEGYGANNTLAETRGLYEQEYGRPPQYNLTPPAAQWINEAEAQKQRQESLEGKNVANASFAEGQARLNDSQARNHANLITQAKQAWGRADALEQQAMAILNNQAATEEEKAQAQSNLVAAGLAKQTASEQARQIRERANRLGIDLTGYGAENTLSEAETNIGFELDKAVRNMFIDQYAMNSSDYYDRKYDEYRQAGLSRRHAQEKAMRDAKEYRVNRMQAARDLFRNIGVSGGQITDDGLSLSHVMYEEGDPEAGALWERSYASPGANWVAEQNRLDADLAHARSEESADNNLARTQALALFNNNLDAANRDIAHQRTQENMKLGADLNLRNAENSMWTQARIADLASDKEFARSVQKLAMQRQWTVEDWEVKKVLNDARSQKIFKAAVEAGWSTGNATLLALGVIDPNKINSGRTRSANSSSEKFSAKEEEARNIVGSYDKELDDMISAGQTELALQTIDGILETLKEDDMRKYDSDLMTDFRRRLEERKRKLIEREKLFQAEGNSSNVSNVTNSNQPPSGALENPDQTANRYADQTQSNPANYMQQNNPYARGYTPGGQSNMGDPNLPSLYDGVKEWIRSAWGNSDYWKNQGY